MLLYASDLVQLWQLGSIQAEVDSLYAEECKLDDCIRLATNIVCEKFHDGWPISFFFKQLSF